MKEFNSAQVSDSLCTEGAFLWWYMDLTTQEGDGLVLVWSLGLPFLPGSRAAALPADRPSLSLAHYQKGKPTFYLLQEYPADEAEFDPINGTGRLGRSRFDVSYQGDEVRLLVDLDAPIPHTKDRLTGIIEVSGPRMGLSQGSRGAAHVWAPQSMNALGQATLRRGDSTHQINGQAYIDKNVSRRRLHDQGIDSWRWGRVSFGEETLTYYDVTPEPGTQSDGAVETLVVRQQADGRWDQFSGSLSFEDEQSGSYNLKTARTVRLDAAEESYEIKLAHLVDDGPYYQRFLTTGRKKSGGVGHGVSEFVVPSRVDLGWQRPFVRMRTHRVAGKNSMWLPLFSGARADRGRRLMRSLSRVGFGS